MHLSPLLLPQPAPATSSYLLMLGSRGKERGRLAEQPVALKLEPASPPEFLIQKVWGEWGASDGDDSY